MGWVPVTRKVFVLICVVIAINVIIEKGFTQSIADSFQYPLQTSWIVSRGFGVLNHLGEDVPAPEGTAVYAAANGIVKFARAGTVDEKGQVTCGVQGYCALVIIEHNTGSEQVTTLYGHLSTKRGLKVKENDIVVNGTTLIGYIAADDEDGLSTGPHLHFGIRKGAYDDRTRICRKWLYVGYALSCEGFTIEQYLAMWYPPADFIKQHSISGPTLRIDGSSTSRRQQLQTFQLTGANFTPNSIATRHIRGSNSFSADPTIPVAADGTLTWNFTPQCTDATGTYDIWVTDSVNGDSNHVNEIIDPNPTCTAPIAEGNRRRLSIQ